MNNYVQMRNSSIRQEQRAPAWLSTERIYSSLELFRSGPPSLTIYDCENNCWSGRCKVPGEIIEIFPYINAVVEGAQYFLEQDIIKFSLGDCLYIVSEKECAFTPVADYGEAVSRLDEFLETIREVVDQHFNITPNYRAHKQQSPLDIFRLLPGNNCRACGYLTCLAFAAALSRQWVGREQCPHMVSPVEEKTVFRIKDGVKGQIKTIEIPSLPKKDPLREANLSSEKKLQEKKSGNEGYATDFFKNTQMTQATDLLAEKLTSRELEVLTLVADGKSNGAIAGSLKISKNTVKTHLDHIFSKMGVNDRTRAAVLGIRTGLLS